MLETYPYDINKYTKMQLNLSKSARYSLLVLGFSAMVIQVLVIRQAMVVFQGNELVIGLALGLWMLLTALGSRLSGHYLSAPSLHLLMAIFSFLAVFMVTWGRYLLVGPGIMAGLDTTVLVLAIALLPFCMVSGMLFPLLSELFSDKNDKINLHRAYALESAGSLAGGLLFSLVMVMYLHTWQSLAVVMALNLLAAAVILWKMQKRFAAYFLAGAIVSLAAVSIFLNPLNMLEKIFYRGQDVIHQQDTPYGRIVVTRLDDQINIYSNGTPMSQTNDVISREEQVHYTMMTRPRAERVLMISGGTGGALEEVLKYPLVTVDYLEPDPFLMEVMEKYAGLPGNERLRIINQDPVRYIAGCDEKYDVILQNAPAPASGLLNRLYTSNHIHQLKRCLEPDGVLQISLPGGANYLSEEALVLHSVVYQSLKKEFLLVGLVPGGRSYFMAGDDLPNKMLGQLYAESGIENLYVNPNYINEWQLGQRSQKIMEQLDDAPEANTNVKPLGYYLLVREWLKQFFVPVWVIPAILCLALIAFIFTLGPLNLGLFSGGLSAASAEFMLLLWLQATYGYVYQMAGLVFTAFMAGLVLGAWVLPGRNRQFTFRTFLLFLLLMSAYLLLLTGFIYLSENAGLAGWLNLALIFFLILTGGAITGLQYTAAIRIRPSMALKNASLSYSADLYGSALGALLVSVFCLPLMGMYWTGMSLAAFSLLIMLALFFRGSK